MRCNLREVRESRGLSQEELAHLSAVTRNTIHNIERGVTNPSLALAFRIANSLHVSLYNIWPGKD